MSKVPMTVRGHDLLEKELKRLKYEDRPNVIQAIAEARGHGDLKENAEYHAAKEKKGFVEGRIREIEAKIAHAEVIDVTQLSGDRVVFGATVTICDVESEEEDDGEEDEVFFGRVIGRRPEGASHWLTPPLRAPNALQASPARFSAPDGGRHSPTGRRSRQGSPSVAQSTSGQQ